MRAPVLFTLFALNALAADDLPPWPSDAASDAIYKRVLRETAPQEAVSPKQKFRAVYRQTNPNVYGHNFGDVTIYDPAGKKIAHRLFTEHGGRLVAVARWSPDSAFCIFTTISAGGHSPWHFDPYVFCRADRSFHYLDIDAVIDWNFRLAAPHTVIFTTRQNYLHFNLAALKSGNS